MSRLIIGIVIFAGVALLAYLGLLALEAVDGMVTPFMMTAGLAASVAVSLVSFLVCLALLTRMSRALNRQKDMLRTVDAALRNYADHADRTTRTVSDVSAQALRQLEAFKQRLSHRDENEAAAAAPRGDDALPDNVIPISPSGSRDAGSPAASTNGYKDALKAAIALGDLEISLQPVVTISRSEASGFEVFAHVDAPGLPPRDVRRLETGLDLADRAVFEQLMVRQAAMASRRNLGEEGRHTPLQVAISNALLQDAESVTQIAETYRKHPALSESLVLSLPIHLVNGAGKRHKEAIARLVDAGATLAVEGWRGDARALAEYTASGVRFIKLSADRLLDREKRRERDLSGAEICEAAAAKSVDIIATGVDSDEDAVCLIDLGVDMMTGERFSGPRRLRHSAV